MKDHLARKQLGQSAAKGREDPLFEVELDLAAKGSRVTARTLHGQLRAAILEGRLTPGARLPPTRRAEAFFGVSRNTAAEVYDRLRNEGLVVARRGSGAYVADAAPAAGSAPPSGEAAANVRLNPFWLRPEVNAAMGFWRDATKPGARTPATARRSTSGRA